LPTFQNEEQALEKNNQTSSNKSLSIRISTDGLSFCAYEPALQQPYSYKEYAVSPIVSMAANVKEALMTEPMLKAQYQRVNVLVGTPEFTTVPSAEFDREKAAGLFQFVFPKTAGRHVSYNVLRRSGVAIVFGFDKNIHQLLLDDFPRARFYASASTLIEFFSEKSLIGSGRKMFVYLHEGELSMRLGQQAQEMTLYCFDQGRLAFVNTYPVRGTNDCQYYILNVWQQLGMDQYDDGLSIVDDSGASQQLVERIRYFVRNATLADRTDDFRDTLTHGNQLLPYDLQTLLVCGF